MISFKTYRLVFILLGFLIAVEVGLEIRAHRKGWETLLFGEPKTMTTQPRTDDGQPLFGPTKEFPFRSVIVPRQKDPRRPRIWIASSSYAQDNYIRPTDIFPYLIGVNLKEKGWDVQILNAAKEGQSIAANVRELRKSAKDWQPDYILLYQMNLDINELSKQFLGQSGGAPKDSGEESVSEPGPSQAQVGWAVKLAEKTTVYQLLKQNITARLSQSRILAPEIGAEARAAFRKRIYDVIEFSRSIGATPILCTFASSHDRKDLDAMPVRVKNFLLRYNVYLSVPGWVKTIEEFNDDIRRIGAEQNVCVIDLNKQIGGRKKYFRDFVHFTKEGHRVMAQSIAQVLAGRRTDFEAQAKHIKHAHEF